MSSKFVLFAAIGFLFYQFSEAVPTLTPESAEILKDYRDTIVLLNDFDTLNENDQLRRLAAARQIDSRKQELVRKVSDQLAGELSAVLEGRSKESPAVDQFLASVSSSPDMYDADRLAFVDVVEDLALTLEDAGKSPSGTADIKKSLDDLQQKLESARKAYGKEIAVIFARVRPRGEQRLKWGDYVALLQKKRNAALILSEHPLEPWESVKPRGKSDLVLFGNDFPVKSVYLTFDDGPHPRFTDRILAILDQYGIKACFFEVGENLGTVSADGQIQLAHGAAIADKILKAGHILANHSYSHPFLPKLSEERRNREIGSTQQLLEKIAGAGPVFFRPPYGAENPGVLKEVESLHMKSMLWDIDSLDWSDPIPESVAARTLSQIAKLQRGIILFHDIHSQTIRALPLVLDELKKANYQFLTYQDGKFVAPAPAKEP